jgi:hypothetical protein
MAPTALFSSNSLLVSKKATNKSRRRGKIGSARRRRPDLAFGRLEAFDHPELIDFESDNSQRTQRDGRASRALQRPDTDPRLHG